MQKQKNRTYTYTTAHEHNTKSEVSNESLGRVEIAIMVARLTLTRKFPSNEDFSSESHTIGNKFLDFELIILFLLLYILNL